MRKKNILKTILTIACLITLFLVSLTACAPSAPDVEWELSVTGDVAQAITVSYQDLASMPQRDLGDVNMEKSTGEDEMTSWRGVALIDLFKQAGVIGISTVTAIASDGYAIEITADELEGAIIALKDNGEWIAEVSPDKGPIRLVTPKTPGNRWVYQIQELQVHK